MAISPSLTYIPSQLNHRLDEILKANLPPNIGLLYVDCSDAHSMVDGTHRIAISVRYVVSPFPFVQAHIKASKPFGEARSARFVFDDDATAQDMVKTILVALRMEQ